MENREFMLRGFDSCPCYLQSKKISTSLRIKGLDMNDKYLIVWNGKKAEIRETRDGELIFVGMHLSYSSS